ncbi:hypothetical protein ACFFSY_02720 [Paenibacillus aurantiacus]|uniref:Uncharacterized protein n=1 Tax=Paenibacillus aurantiacus TaxID=1936118 RepID=A0ABV5KHZ8_9BACL
MNEKIVIPAEKIIEHLGISNKFFEAWKTVNLQAEEQNPSVASEKKVM